MFEIDKLQFGRFLSVRRKEKNLTQKALAEKLFISDKAVSKWERGLSLPDISLLIPLADILDITVTELLEGKRMEESYTEHSKQVDVLVKKALAFSDKPPEKSAERRKKHRIICASGALFAVVQWPVIFLISENFLNVINSGILTLQVIGLIFMFYFWIYAKERLPAYYDENPIHCYHDGYFEMNMPPLCFNNRNWPHILRVCRIWSLLDTTVIPVCIFCINLLIPETWHLDIFFIIMFCCSLGGFFVPVYLVGKKYE